MPQLLSRRDDAGWLTPAMADILTQVPAYLPGEDLLRAQMGELQQKLADNEAPVRIVDVRPSPSHILYIARPEPVGRLGSRRPVTPNEVRRGLGLIAEQRKDWILGFLNRLHESDDSMGILLRMTQHKPLQLRQLLISNTYINRPSPLTVVLGVALQQQAVIHDLATIGHLLLVGSEAGRQHFIHQLLLTLLLFNTPPELRLAFIGGSVKTYRDLSQTPHTLGRLIEAPEQGIRLLDGMVKEGERRRQWLLEHGAENLEAYNTHLQNQGDSPVPRIVILFDSLSDVNWQTERERWLPAVYDLLVNGARVGIHLLMTASQPDDTPELITETIRNQIVMRSANPALAERLPYMHSSALRFIDAFLLTSESVPQEQSITPIELCSISREDIQRLVAYWRQISIQRSQESIPQERTGFTGMLREVTEGRNESAAAPPVAPAPSLRAAASTLARATSALSGSDENRTLRQAQALAAYLGWMGIGPLRDVLGLSAAEARSTLEALQQAGVIEEGDSNTLRFIRLSPNPLETEG